MCAAEVVCKGRGGAGAAGLEIVLSAIWLKLCLPEWRGMWCNGNQLHMGSRLHKQAAASVHLRSLGSGTPGLDVTLLHKGRDMAWHGVLAAEAVVSCPHAGRHGR